MTEKDVSILLKQIRNIILNKPIEVEVLEDKTPAAGELQQGITYLSNCLIESNQFLQSLAEGNLEADIPGRHNFLAGELKQLHAGLKHLTWQTSQVVRGDYKQRVDFMGDFSRSFNEMIIQLEKREHDLKEQAEKLVSIMDSLKDWVMVTEVETGILLYANQTAKQRFYDPDIKKYTCGEGCYFMDHLKSCITLEQEIQYEFKCPKNKVLLVKSCSLLWGEKKAMVHLITDITFQRENEAFLEYMAYKDELTGLDNRRSCLRSIDTYIQNNIPFSLCMIDLDGLKKINDQYGHLCGDEYIKIVSQSLRETAGNVDFTCRFGGDEFVVLMPYCNEKRAKEKMALIDKRILDMEKKYPMSISYGVVYVTKRRHLLLEEALNLADERMYYFKRLRKEKREDGVNNGS